MTQYVVQHKTRYGIGGWLGVWMVIFTLSGISYIGGFFAQLDADDRDVDDLIFFPILAVLCIATVALIASRRAVGKWSAIATLVAGGVYASVKIFTSGDDDSTAATMGSFIITWVVLGVLALYFVQSDRVRQTLTRV